MVTTVPVEAELVTQGADVLMVGVPNLLIPARASQMRAAPAGAGGITRSRCVFSLAPISLCLGYV